MAIPNENDPLALFRAWFQEAADCPGIEDHTAMALATTDPGGAPDVRMVLLKRFDERGFAFFTNLGSPKAAHLANNPRAALCFHWEPLGKQIRIRGPVTRVTPEEADAYFASRERLSRIGAWASKQSQPLAGHFELEKRVALFTAQYGLGAIPRPPFWDGFRIVPHAIEFWLKQPYRLHDRVVFRLEDSGWTRTRLFP